MKTRTRPRHGMTSLQAVILLGAGFLVVWGLMELFDGSKGTANTNTALTLRGEFKRPAARATQAPQVAPPLVADPEDEPLRPNQDPLPQPPAEEEGRGYLAIVGDVVTVGVGTGVGVLSTGGAVVSAGTGVGAPLAVGLGVVALSNFDDAIAAGRRLLGDKDAESLKYNVTKEVTGSETAARVVDIAASIGLGGKPGGAARVADDVLRAGDDVLRFGDDANRIVAEVAEAVARYGDEIAEGAGAAGRAARALQVPAELEEFRSKFGRLGGSYGELRDMVKKLPETVQAQLEVHHIPQNAFLKLGIDGPAIVMFKPHHRALPSSRGGRELLKDLRGDFASDFEAGLTEATREIADLMRDMAKAEGATIKGPLYDAYNQGIRESLEYLAKTDKLPKP